VRDQLKSPDATEGAKSSLQDRLTLLRARTQWIVETVSRQHLEKQIDEVWALAITP
jgi:hypothetical protein